MNWLINIGSAKQRFETEDEARAEFAGIIERHEARGRGLIVVTLSEWNGLRWFQHERREVRRGGSLVPFAHIRKAAYDLGAQDPLPFHGFRGADGKFVSLND